MGLWSWLFPSPDDRIARARNLLETGRAEFARLEVLDIDRDDARALLHQAENVLALRNLEAAIQYASQGDDVKAAERLELAERFHHGGHEANFTEARREMREIRTARSEAETRAKEERNARLLAVDPLGMTGGPSFLDRTDTGDLFDPEREEMEQRVALIIESYPEALKAGASKLGPEFAEAVLALDDGKPAEAMQKLLALPDDSPLVCWERARAAHALSDGAAAAAAARDFAKYAGGHHTIGSLHTGTFLASRLAEQGDLNAAMRVLRDVRAGGTLPPSGDYLLAQLLYATRQWPEAEAILSPLIRKHPKEAPLYTLLARVRAAGGERVAAMRALEASLEAICCTPGKCGTQAPDLDTHRLLATLYLEDGIETRRALELAETASTLVSGPMTWDDAYLAALVAKAKGAPDAPELARRLSSLTPAEHEGQKRLARYLPA